jgi:hypothetical protein
MWRNSTMLTTVATMPKHAKASEALESRVELFPFKIRSGTKPLFIDQNGVNFAHDISIFARKVPCTSR